MKIKIIKETFFVNNKNIEEHNIRVEYKGKLIVSSFSKDHRYISYVYQSIDNSSSTLRGDVIEGEVGTTVYFTGNNLFEVTDKAIKHIDKHIDNDNKPRLKVA